MIGLGRLFSRTVQKPVLRRDDLNIATGESAGYGDGGAHNVAFGIFTTKQKAQYGYNNVYLGPGLDQRYRDFCQRLDAALSSFDQRQKLL